MVDRLRKSISEIELPADHADLQFTVSIGITNLTAGDESMTTVMQRADQALYQAKSAGRNRVVYR